jgi:flagellar FliJ protein
LKRFQFDMEKILSIRVHREQEAEIALGRAVGALAVIEGQLKSLAEERSHAAADRFTSGVNAAELGVFDRYLRRLDASRERLLEEAAQAELKVEEARRLFMDASRERKILDKLKERRQAEYRKLSMQEAVKTVDDISSGAVARRMVLG